MQKTLEWGILAGSVGPRVRLLRNALTARSIAVSAPFGLPTGSLTVLALIAANPGSSQSALAKRAGLNKSALVGIVDQLEAKGLAARDRSATDRRRNQVTVTPRARRRCRRCSGGCARGKGDPERARLGGPRSAARPARPRDRRDGER
jgi:DNA-binding MarR family transcriptional regulator